MVLGVDAKQRAGDAEANRAGLTREATTLGGAPNVVLLATADRVRQDGERASEDEGDQQRAGDGEDPAPGRRGRGRGTVPGLRLRNGVGRGFRPGPRPRGSRPR